MTQLHRPSNPEVSPPAKYRVNPIEWGILAAAVAVFFHSSYQFIDSSQDLAPAALAPAHERPSIQSRSPASLSQKSGIHQNQNAVSYTVECSGEHALTTLTAPRVRLTGSPCRGSGVPASAALRSVTAQIQGQKSSIEVFVQTGGEAEAFTTTYFELFPGENTVILKFDYEGAPSVSQSFRFHHL